MRGETRFTLDLVFDLNFIYEYILKEEKLKLEFDLETSLSPFLLFSQHVLSHTRFFVLAMVMLPQIQSSFEIAFKIMCITPQHALLLRPYSRSHVKIG